VSLRHEDGCSFAEISAAMGLPLREVMVIHRAALLQLRHKADNRDGHLPEFQPLRVGACELVLLAPEPCENRRRLVGGVRPRARLPKVADGQLMIF
jgi:hypothetical protein